MSSTGKSNCRLTLSATACVAQPTATPIPIPTAFPAVFPTPTVTSTPLQELADRLFLSGPGPHQRPQITLGSLPPDFNFPVPEGTRVVGSVALGGGHLRMFSPDIPLDPEKTVEFFRDALAQNGWEAQESLDSRLNSFESGAVAVFCREEDISMMLEVALYRDGVTAVRMFIQESGAFRCHGQGWPRKVGALGVLPALTAPEGSTWESTQVFVARSGGGLDQPGLVKAAVTWSTGLDAKSAEEHFRNQLAQAGWVLKERGGGGPVAWSTWDVKDEPGGSWDGLLVVIRLPGGETSALFRLYPTAPVLAPTPARVPVPEDRAGLEELFGRFFQSEGQVQILPEALPPGFSITLPPGAKVVGSVVFAEEGFVAEGFVAEEAQTIEAQIIEAQIIIDVAMEPGEVEEFFQEELAETGWKSLQRSLPRGFVSAEGKPAGSTLFFTLCNDVENISMHFTTFPLEDGRSGVNIMYRNQTPSICDWPGPSAPSLPTLPALKMPVGTKAQGSGSGEGGDNAHAEVTLVTDLSAVALEEHFAEQLADFAWARVAEGADGPTSWSVWQYEGSDGSPWVGLLLAIDLPDGKTSYATLNTVQRGSYQWEGHPAAWSTPAPTPLPGSVPTLTKLVYGISADDPSIEQIEGTMEIIRRRLRAFGLEGTATTAGGDQITIELRDVSDAELVKRLIGQTARLEFKERTCSDPLCQEFTDSDTLLIGDDLVDAFASTDQTTSQWTVNIHFNSRGADIFSELTRRIVGIPTKRIAVFLDDDELIAPVVRGWIRDGQIQITGNFSQEEARTLAVQLESGHLPMSLELILEEVQ